MADNARVAITKLNNENYQVWKYKMELLLIKEDLWDAIALPRPAQPDAKWIKRDGKARATIGLLIDDNQLVHVRKLDTAKECWEALRLYHERSTLTTKVMLLKKLCRMQLQSGGDMEEHINVMLDIVDRLTCIGEDLAEHLVVALLLCSLPDTYDTLITALETRQDTDLTLELVKSKLIHEYKRRHELQDGDNEKELAFKLNSKTPLKRQVKGACHYCQKPGHYKRDCYAYKNANKNVNKQKSYNANNVMCMQTHENEKDTENQICFKIEQEQVTNFNQWYVDSGATSHMTNNKSFFTHIDESVSDTVYLADGKCLHAKGMGEGMLMCNKGNQGTHQVRVKDVLFVPELKGSLLSVQKLTQNGMTVKFKNKMCTISKGGMLIANARTDSNLYKLIQGNGGSTEGNNALTVSRAHGNACIHDWHRRLGHRSTDAINTLVTKKLATGNKISKCNADTNCEDCLKGKMPRKPFPKVASYRSSSVLDLIHTDICGPMQTKTPGSKRYVLTMIDDFSRYCVVYLMEKKSDTLGHIQNYVQMVENKFQRPVNVIRTDGGGEYFGSEFTRYLESKGIQRQTSAPYSPQQNGVAERKNRILLEMTRCMLLDAKLDNKYWGEAVCTANYMQNKLPTSACDKTPHELWNGHPPNLEHIRTFGCTAHAHVKVNRRKLDAKAQKLTLMGYAQGYKAYRLVDTSNNRVYISRDVSFSEQFCSPKENSVDLQTGTNVVDTQMDISHDEQCVVDMNSNATENDAATNEHDDGQEIRRSQRSTKGIKPAKYACAAITSLARGST